MADRAEAVAVAGAALRTSWRSASGCPDRAQLSYRPRSGAREAGELAAELLERRAADLQRGFTAHGPHRDELRLAHDGQALRSYGSQGQQRVALLALLFAERDLLAAERGRPPLMLLDDVMSELDSARRELLAEMLRAGGQGVVTTTDADHVPGAGDEGVRVGARGRRAADAHAPARRGGRMRRAGPRPFARCPGGSGRACGARRGCWHACRPVGPTWPGPPSLRRPVRSRSDGGKLTFNCRSAAWAQELELLAPELLERLNGALAEGRRPTSDAAALPCRPARPVTAGNPTISGQRCFVPICGSFLALQSVRSPG